MSITRFEVKCIKCQKPSIFTDVFDVKQSNWNILGWNMNSGYPICICDKCEKINKNKNKS